MSELDDTGRPPVALVAGASRGLGLLISAELLRRGFRVHGCSHDEAAISRAAAQLPSGFSGHVVDVRDPAAVAALVNEVHAEEGRLDVALHVAGIIQVVPLTSVTLGHFRDSVDTMLWGPIHLSLAVLPHMRQAGSGRIGIISSVGGLVSVPRLLPYSVAKFGAVGLAEGLAAELAGTGVTVTSVTPGLMRTGGHLAARFAGDATKDYAWFAPGASLPGLSVGGDRAARRIVNAVLAGRPTLDLTPLTMIGRRVHGVAPTTTVRLMGVAARLLPDGPERDPLDRSAPSVSGASVRARLGSRLVNGLAVLGDRMAERANQPTEPRPDP